MLSVTAYPFLSVAIDPSTGHVILGSADGKVSAYCVILLYVMLLPLATCLRHGWYSSVSARG